MSVATEMELSALSDRILCSLELRHCVRNLQHAMDHTRDPGMNADIRLLIAGVLALLRDTPKEAHVDA